MTPVKPPSVASGRPRGRPKEARFLKPVETPVNQSLEKALGLLKTLSDHDGLTLTELSEATGLPPSTAHRLLGTLSVHELAIMDEASQKWSIGIESLRIGAAFQRRNSVISAGRAAMTDLMEATGETVNLAILDRFEVVFVSQVECHEPIRAFFAIGQRRAIHASGIGKALLAHMPVDRLNGWLARAALPGFTPATITDADELRAELTVTKARGWALDDEEANPGMRCIAAPVYNVYGEATAGISLSGPSTRLTPQRLPELGLKVRETADHISRLTGGGLLA
ncbi:MAG: IclR family transcriptional regulator [Asticcacaulis sp.]|uniref:IclR family transcriptional regulator n=1 Tax=Asticcacaulis sp. TaxID=1872648 RepID=UPI0039E55782